MFETLPSNFFNLLVSKERDIYIKALFAIRKAMRQDLYLTRDDLAKRIAISLEDDIKNASLEDDGKFESEDLSSISNKALYIIRKLRDYGWINIDFNAKNSFEEYVAVPSYSTQAINFLYGLTNDAEQEYNSLVYSTYAALKMADSDNNDYYDALMSAYKNTDKINETLANLYYGIRSIEQRIAEHIEINDVVSIHFNEYLSKLHDQYYHPYKTFDSIERFRNPIMKLIRNWRNNATIRKKLLQSAKEKNPNKKGDALYEMITHMFDYVYQAYDDIEDKMDIIDKKINDYTSATIDKMKHLVNMDESYKGKLMSLVKTLNDNKGHEDEICDMIVDSTILQLQEYASKEGLYSKREVQISPDLPPIEIIIEEKIGDDVDEIFDKIAQGYNTNKIKEFILSRAEGRKEVSIQDIKIETDEDFILSILAMLRGDEKELPFKVEFDEGYLHVKNYLVPNIKFIVKEGKK
ncbi:MAG: DUF5716 family protein [Erysipelotrichaceae bacterium]|nr:DUF5716 family protein [Erysipelotrichaceae bacterium]